MATFTSVTSGNWNDGATWGKTSPGVKGTDWPGNAGDVVNIGTTANQSHVVTYNVSEANALGQITIGATSGTGASRLEFSRSVNTKLTLGHQDLLVQATGELRVGASGAIIPKVYTAELIWNTTTDNAKGLNIASGGKWNVYGDPDYYGSDYDTTLISQAVIPAAGNTVTITVTGDFTTKWIAGQELLVHKGGSYASSTDDFCRLTITSVAANGANTDVSCTVTERPATLTCLVGADVLHLSRNVMFYKSGYNVNLGQMNTSRPKVFNANVPGTANINVSDALFGGFYSVGEGYGVFLNGVLRNGYRATASLYKSIVNGIIFSFTFGIYATAFCTSTSHIVNCANAIQQGYGLTLNGSIYGNSGRAITNATNCICNSHIYANNSGITAFTGLMKGNIGYDGAGVQKSNSTDIDPTLLVLNQTFNLCSFTIINALTSAPADIIARNSLTYLFRLKFEHYQQVANAHYVVDNFGDICKVTADGSDDNPNQRPNGGVSVLEIVSLSNCSFINFTYLELLNVRLWAVAGVSKTYRFYVQTDYVTLPTAELKLYGEYLEQLSGGHLATVSSAQDIATRANASDWSQYVEVTINPAQDGYVNLYLRLMGYEAGKKVWVDPKPEGVAMTPRWSYGEVVLEPAITSVHLTQVVKEMEVTVAAAEPLAVELETAEISVELRDDQ